MVFLQVRLKVSPARAGIGRLLIAASAAVYGFPRSRGDRPNESK